ncbi:SRPBCC family protein [Chelatococcus daeguensis]|uniref:Activator of Hsp90 ATPase homologue 1/2-like C-terminal domain-containing protein n=2 Tax=Chelatococcus TaxID=28209 RepID=A0AAC9JTK1_9HYPH|nr:MULTISPECIES: SRPBCC family protein [Chelatococcus]APF38381.1 hypothetical protein BOQ54_14500 [Chelatococcus daeguensis]KZE34508.1 hypothetical protein AVW15_16730 [Chelatococcus daeguensis]MBM3083064.1 SRPBCC family protein [Chelatococcus daeguensis]CUA84908.1 Uncharacterized conserved protein YndB, AHSA1/START domain [Chelatococcus sambhunathii]
MPDTIEKTIHLKAPPDRVWRALSDSTEFGRWFRAEVTGEIREGAVLSCRSLYPGTEHMRWDMRIVTLEPGRRLVWDWPAFDPAAFPGDPDSDARLTVSITLTPEGAGTRLTLVESGFADLPEGPALAVWQRNEGGWTMQMQNIVDHVAT